MHNNGRGLRPPRTPPDHPASRPFDHQTLRPPDHQTEMKTLRETKVGETAVVVKLHGTGALKRRVMDMGITKGTELYVHKVAPLGDPIEITVRGYELSLRRDDVDIIEIA